MPELDESHETTAGPVRAGRFGDGSPLVPVQGWPWSSQARRRVLPALARRYRVPRYDMPGVGRSAACPGADTGPAALAPRAGQPEAAA
jgi:pimeloyl-ACP methyl ester carboxylesterase